MLKEMSCLQAYEITLYIKKENAFEFNYMECNVW